MKFKVIVYVSSKKACRDPQEEVVLKAIHQLGFSKVESVRMAKCFSVTLEADDEPDAHIQVGQIGQRLLAQSVAEEFQIGDISYAGRWPATVSPAA